MNKTAIFVSLIFAGAIIVASFMFYTSKENDRQERKTERTQVAIREQQKEVGKIAGEIVSEGQLEACLDEVDNRFNKALDENDTSSFDTEAWKLVLDEKQNQKDECYKLHQ